MDAKNRKYSIKSYLSILIIILFMGAVTIAGVGCSNSDTAPGSGSDTRLPPKGGTLVSIEVTPTNPSVPLGLTKQFTAMGIYSDSSTDDITTDVTWSSSDPLKATISSEGLATTLAVGATTISATLGEVSGSTVLTVTDAELDSIDITPTNPSVPLGLAQQFTATGTYTDDSTQDITDQVAWSSSDLTVATINSNGLAATLKVGPTTISATLDGVTGATLLTVTDAELDSIDITPTNPSVPLGLVRQFTATGTYTDSTTQDITTQVTWASSDPSKATINSVGLATTLAAGETTIGATLGEVAGSTLLTVSNAQLESIQVTPTNPSVPLGLTQQFTATGIYSDSSTQDITTQVTWWVCCEPGIAVISNAAGSQGVATTLKVGVITVSATLGEVSGATVLTVTPAQVVSLEITPTNPSVPLGLTQQFTATAIYSDNTTQNVTTQVDCWMSLDTSVATISNAAGSNGLATTVAVGTTEICATFDGVTGCTMLTVTEAVLVSIEVTPANPSVPLGLTQQFTATGVYSDSSTQNITTQVSWSSSVPSVATISNAAGSQGEATTVGLDKTMICATLNGIIGCTVLTVTEAELVSIEVTPTNPSVPLGLDQQFTATGIYTDGARNITTQVTWCSSVLSVATISNASGTKGIATTVAEGTTEIEATLDGISGSTVLTVTPEELVSIRVTPTNPSVPLGLNVQFEAEGTYTAGTKMDITKFVMWNSSEPHKAAISNAAGAEGFATTLAVGQTTISATLDGVTGFAVLTITSAQLVAIDIEPSVTQYIPLGLQIQYAAIGIYTDGTTQVLTTQATWSSSDELVATINNATKGLAITVGEGDTEISATFGLITGKTLLVVTDAALVSIEVTPANPSIPVDSGFQQFTATGTYTDSSTQDITEQVQVTWSSSDELVATISNTAPKGFATAVDVGTTTISAELGGLTGWVCLNVAELVSIDVTPIYAAVYTGNTQQFDAEGTYDNGDTVPITGLVTWSSADTTVATISNVPGTKGLATTVAEGTTEIEAEFIGIFGNADLDVTLAP